MGKINRLICLCLLAAFSLTLHAQTDFFLSHLGVENGLSQISVLKIFQDSEGYLWFGTRDGVNKYNGYEFTVYRNEVNNPESLSDGYIQGIAEDEKKNIWVATQFGLNCIEYITGKITRFYPREMADADMTNAVNQFLLHSDGNLYAVSEKYIFVCHSDQTAEFFMYMQDMPANITEIKQDPVSGSIYIAVSGHGVFVYSADWKYERALLAGSVPDDTGFRESTIQLILPQAEGLWMGASQQKGLYFFDKETGKITLYDDSNTGISNNSVRAIIPYGTDSLLIGTFRGLNILHKKDHTISPVNMNIEGEGGLSHYSVHSLLWDRDQTLWIGTYSAGINYYSPYYKPISFITPEKFTGVMGMGQEDSEGNMWFATEGAGLMSYNPKTKAHELYPLKPIEQGNYEVNIFKSLFVKGDTIYCGTHFGSVYTFSIQTKKYSLLFDSHTNDIYNLYVDSSNRLWIPTSNTNNLVMMDGKKTQNSFEIQEGETTSFRLVNTIKEIKPEVFLLGTLTDSVYLYDLNKKQLTNIAFRMHGGEEHLKLGYTTSIVPDASHIWISTNKAGLFRFDRELNLQKHYQGEDGLSESNISSVICDKNGDLWVATGTELYKRNRFDDKFIPVKPGNLPAQEFTRHAASISSDGTLYFPTSESILFFDPSRIKTNPVVPPLHITSLVVNNKQEVLNRIDPYSATPEIRLKANETNLSIRYAALNYIHAEENRYMYILEGADNDWHHVGSRREAYYSRLRPGNYSLRIKASNNDGVWNPQEKTLHIIVEPPFYQTWWAYTLYILAILFIAGLIMRYQYRKLELERNIRFKQKEQERMKELHDERMRMFTNFSHELRTPLTLIINPLEELLHHLSFSAEVKQSLKLMKKNTRRMLLLVNNLMDVQKYETGKTLLQKKRFDFSAFVREVYNSFEQIAQKRQIDFVLMNELPEVYYVNYDETEIEKVFFNLLSNAFKFTPPQGKVTMRIRVEAKQIEELLPPDKLKINENPVDSYLYIEIEDTGKGFSMEESAKIFEPFYQFEKDLHQQISGTGIGLSLSRSIVVQHNGYIWAESRAKIGTRFMVLLPDTEIVHEESVEPGLPNVSETYKKTMLLLEEGEIQHKQVILVVDDDPEILQYMKEQLNIDYKVYTATNGKEALERMNKKPQLVISDVVMPEMNGIELCKYIKSNPEFNHIPVILLTGKSMPSQIEEGLEAGADDYIVKPFQLNLVKARIKNLLLSRVKPTAAPTASQTLKEIGIDIPEKDDFMSQYIEIVKNNISNQDLDISLIYESLGMSRANFYRKVKAATGLSPIELIRNIRVEVGAQLLRDTDLNISEIAQRTGFASRSYFARNFKSVYGLSPTEYQEVNRGK